MTSLISRRECLKIFLGTAIASTLFPQMVSFASSKIGTPQAMQRVSRIIIAGTKLEVHSPRPIKLGNGLPVHHFSETNHTDYLDHFSDVGTTNTLGFATYAGKTIIDSVLFDIGRSSIDMMHFSDRREFQSAFQKMTAYFDLTLSKKDIDLIASSLLQGLPMVGFYMGMA